VYWTFSHTPHRRNLLTWPIRALMVLIFQIFIPLVLFYMDRLDRVQDETLGHACVAIKLPKD
jgi:hypothetical protein